ncbi:MAG: hypothetical protein HYV13_03190 [Candidatus Doudnabacteria bacterium]|nr:hypothetical protein [Candidatus Doudnabacteria bacterium]
MSKAKFVVFSLAFMLVFGMWGHASAAVVIMPGDLVKTQNSSVVFYMDDAKQNLPLDASGFAIRYGSDFSKIKIVAESDIKPYTGHNFLNRMLSVPEGSLIMYYPDPTVYLVKNGMKQPFTSWQAFTSRGYKSSDIKLVGTYHVYATGPNLN